MLLYILPVCSALLWWDQGRTNCMYFKISPTSKITQITLVEVTFIFWKYPRGHTTWYLSACTVPVPIVPLCVLSAPYLHPFFYFCKVCHRLRAFFFDRNPRVPCQSLPRPNLKAWQESQNGCHFRGRFFSVGESYLPTPCTSCICTTQGVSLGKVHPNSSVCFTDKTILSTYPF